MSNITFKLSLWRLFRAASFVYMWRHKMAEGRGTPKFEGFGNGIFYLFIYFFMKEGGELDYRLV